MLRPDGIAVFCEPWGENPLLNWVRRMVPYPGKQRTVDEKPLSIAKWRVLRASFPKVEIRVSAFLHASPGYKSGDGGGSRALRSIGYFELFTPPKILPIYGFTLHAEVTMTPAS